ncbi:MULTISPECIES: chaplin [Streptomyces]|uniref:chaplin n=1 Tax=Streptomyces TaxID=1883 RepID=UPI003BF56B68|nr:chaplin [Streptomyces sp. A1-5]
MANSGAQGAAVRSPGFASGNLAQMPIHMPINLCGNTINSESASEFCASHCEFPVSVTPEQANSW